MTSDCGINPGPSPLGAGVTARLDRDAVLDWYRRNRARSAQLFDMLAERCYVTRPIALRNPIVFYEGHLPGFSVNTLIKKGRSRPGVDARLEEIFARGIDPEYVPKGASPATAHELLRPSFRNWFRPHYPYVYASFRCARSLA